MIRFPESSCGPFNCQLLENHIKSEIIEKSQLVHAPPNAKEIRPLLSDPSRSASIACGAAVFEVWMRAPTWALQVLFALFLLINDFGSSVLWHIYLFLINLVLIVVYLSRF